MGFLDRAWEDLKSSANDVYKDSVLDQFTKAAADFRGEVYREVTGENAAERKAKKAAEEAKRLEDERNARVQKSLDEIPTSAIDTRGQASATAKRKGRQSTLLTGAAGEKGKLGGTKSRKTLLGA